MNSTKEMILEKDVNPKYRQRFHLNSPRGWINDPNGVCYFKDKIHLFYQHNPYSSEWSTMHWGHAVSDDMIKWTHLPIAMYPDQTGIDDHQGVFSGSTLVENDVMRIFYTGVGGDKTKTPIQQVCYAESTDGVNFTKYGSNPIIGIEQVPDVLESDRFRDPKIFKKNGKYYIVIGIEEKVSGQVYLFESEDSYNWKLKSKLLKTGEVDDGLQVHVRGVIECPDYFEVDGQGIITGCFMNLKKNGNTRQNVHPPMYCVGNIDFETGEFEYTAVKDIDFGHDFYAQQTLNHPDGRVIMLAWMQTLCRSFPTHDLNHKWCGSHILPRELSFKNGLLYNNPIREIENYRANEITVEELQLIRKKTIKGISGNCIELSFDLLKGNYSKAGVEVLTGENEKTLIYYDKQEKAMVVDVENSGLKVKAYEEEEYNKRLVNVDFVNDVIKMRIFIDVCSVEVFINDGMYSMTSLVFPTEGDGISFFSEGAEATIKNIKKYDIIVK